jgi:O-antigen biosynthesis protein
MISERPSATEELALRSANERSQTAVPSEFQYDVIIPNYVTEQSRSMVLNCLVSLRLYTADYRLIFVDNASPDFDAIQEELKQHPQHLIRNAANVGFVQAVNQGLKASTAPYVVLLNNDTEVVPGWTERLRAALSGSVGLAGPRSNLNGTLSASMPYQKPTVLPKPSMLVFFCVMIRRDVIDKIGVLNERFGVGMGDDDDYCERAQAAGFDLNYVGDLVVFHYHRMTFRSLYTEKELRSLIRRSQRLLASRFPTWYTRLRSFVVRHFPT